MNHLALTLKNEEPHINTIAIRPGVVDTAMQEALRGPYRGKMDPKDSERFMNLKRSHSCKTLSTLQPNSTEYYTNIDNAQFKWLISGFPSTETRATRQCHCETFAGCPSRTERTIFEVGKSSRDTESMTDSTEAGTMKGSEIFRTD